MNSETVEDYLKAIYTLQEKEGRAKTSALARQLGVTAGSVTEMIKRLAAADADLVTYRQQHGVRLTAAGRQVALDIIRRHRLLETFLHQVLGLSWGEVHTEAEKLEHHLSPRVTDAIDRLLGHPRLDPHGEPIPSKTGQLPDVPHQKLTDADVGAKVRIVRVDPFREDLLPYLDKMGIRLNIKALIVDKAPFKGPVTLRVLDGKHQRECSLGHHVSEHVFVTTI
jgi:DtxR family Mn-dependent transcriptional regulator